MTNVTLHTSVQNDHIILLIPLLFTHHVASLYKTVERIISCIQRGICGGRTYIRDDSSIAPSQWEMALFYSDVSQCLGALYIVHCTNKRHPIYHTRPQVMRCLCGYFDDNWSCNKGTALSWWRHQMETFSALLTFCAGNSPVPGEFPAQRPVTRSFEIFFDLRPNKRLSKQSWGWWSETPSSSLWRHRNGVNSV